VNSWVRNQVGLEFGDIDVQSTIESEGGSEGGDDLSDESVQVGVGRSLDVQVSSADIVDSFVVEHNGDISVFKEGVGGENGVVGFYDCSGDLRRGIDGESELGFFAVVNGESFQEERAESGTGTTTDGVEDEETLETSAVVSKFSDSVQTEIDDFFTNGVVSSGEVVSSIFLTGDQLFGVEQLSVGTSSDFINNGGFQIEED
jgi:hypothetical protein